MKKIVLVSVLPFLLLASNVLAVDGGPTVTAGDPVVTTVTPVEEAEKVIDTAIADIDADPGAAINMLVQMAKEGRWGPFAGLLVMLLIWVLRKFIWKLIPKSALPWVTLAAGMLVTGAIGFSMGTVWWKVLIDAFATSGIAMGFWSLLFKHFMKPAEQ